MFARDGPTSGDTGPFTARKTTVVLVVKGSLRAEQSDLQSRAGRLVAARLSLRGQSGPTWENSGIYPIREKERTFYYLL